MQRLNIICQTQYSCLFHYCLFLSMSALHEVMCKNGINKTPWCEGPSISVQHSHTGESAVKQGDYAEWAWFWHNRKQV